ncbi:MAG: hypothetical protein V1859_10645 [archaeon]
MEKIILKQIPLNISSTDFTFGIKKKELSFDIYLKENEALIVSTDRFYFNGSYLCEIPFKGEIIQGISLFWKKLCEDIVRNPDTICNEV